MEAVPAAPAGAGLATPALAVLPGQVSLDITGVARYLVTGGQEILIDPAPGAAPREVVFFLLGPVLGVLLHQRCLLPLRGSAVETSEGALIFVGPTGVGKSTLAGHFQRRGYRLLSDEISGVTPDGRGGFLVLPAFPQLNLCADAYVRLGGSGGQLQGERFALALDQSFCPLPTPLRAICFLLDHGEASMSLRPLVGLERMGWLLANVYRPELLENLEAGAQVIRMAGNVARAAELVALLRPWDPERIEEAVDLLEAVLAGGKPHLRKRRA